MIRKIVIAISTLAVLTLGVQLVNAQPAPGGGPRIGGGGFSGGPGFRGPGAGYSNFRGAYTGPRAPYFGSRFTPPPAWGPRFAPPGPYWGPRYWFWITWSPAPWPIYDYYYPAPYPYYYYYPYPYYDYDYNKYYDRSTAGYKYGNDNANPGPENEYQQPSGKSNEESMQQENVDPKKYQHEYETWIVGQLGISGKEKQQFLTQLKKLQSLRESFMKKRGALTDELANLQQKGTPDTELSSKMTQIEELDKKFQKDEQATLSKLMSSLTVEQRAKYYSLQSQYGQPQQGQAQEQEEEPQP